MDHQGRDMTDSITTSSIEKMWHPWYQVRETIPILKEQEQNLGQVSNSHFCTLPCVITHFRDSQSFIIILAMPPCPGHAAFFSVHFLWSCLTTPFVNPLLLFSVNS
jgi:hypothetical protein